jgi:hypothetical protein
MAAGAAAARGTVCAWPATSTAIVPPRTGLITVWIRSEAESRYAILSTTNWTTKSTPAMLSTSARSSVGGTAATWPYLPSNPISSTTA